MSNKQIKCPFCKKTFIVIDSNQNRQKILNILKTSSNSIIISRIKEKMDISYKSVYEHIKILEETNLIELTKNPNASGQEVLVRLK